MDLLGLRLGVPFSVLTGADALIFELSRFMGFNRNVNTRCRLKVLPSERGTYVWLQEYAGTMEELGIKWLGTRRATRTPEHALLLGAGNNAVVVARSKAFVHLIPLFPNLPLSHITPGNPRRILKKLIFTGPTIHLVASSLVDSENRSGIPLDA
ncbi:uncharacterized protein EV420DRAFT_1485635 [Desarmillaria tabescens]|uniref:Uncharacterized protein n=1 Tax=Armillaria tabescens TaxID=1929756 RepID=A0AA39MPQ7_ARMTA|nr:uncharacterized protein EV420DRAFT_1485635 [Desarmillaria tabescens]KAK0441469.1 hypothetical protein EV420DRAFT_1485635 [Desarmillaria tabescens]